MKFLRNPAWLAVLIGVLAIAVSLALYFDARSVKKLRVEILSNSPLVSINTDLPKEIQILYKTVPVKSLSLILLRIANTGTEPIKESDYSDPIRVTMSQSASVGEVTIQETRPDTIELAPIISASNQVELPKVLLNPGDQAVLRILVLNNDSTLRITARIVGVSALDIQSVLERSDTKAPRWASVLLGTLIAFLILLISALLIWWSRTMVEWRRKRFGFDPARYYYTLAQGGMLTLPFSKDTASASGALTQVIGYLDKAFTWDVTYMERIKNDPSFSQLLGYEKYKDITAKHKARTPDAPSTSEKEPTGE